MIHTCRFLHSQLLSWRTQNCPLTFTTVSVNTNLSASHRLPVWPWPLANLEPCPAIMQGDMTRQCTTERDCGQFEQCCVMGAQRFCTTALEADAETISKFLQWHSKFPIIPGFWLSALAFLLNTECMYSHSNAACVPITRFLPPIGGRGLLADVATVFYWFLWCLYRSC